MLLAVMIPGAPFSIKIVGLFLTAAGLARLGIPRRLAGWLQQNKDRLTEAVDPGAAVVAQTPRVPLEDLLGSPPAGGVADGPARGMADERAAAPPAHGTPAGQEQPGGPNGAPVTHQP